MTNAIDLKSLERSVIDICYQASDKILQVYQTAFKVDAKNDHSPVTEADMAAHEIIVDGLSQLSPKYPVLSEEGSMASYAERRQWSTYWLIDPLDGTREFVKRNDQFTINVALIENSKPVIGVVLVPVSNTLYYSSAGHGAYKQVNTEDPEKIAVRTSDEHMLIVAGSLSHSSSAMADFVQKIGNHKLIQVGSSLKICMVAEGEVDIYPRFGPTSEWDTAAAQCILEQAGGKLTDTNMQPIKYNTKESLLNPNFLAFGDSNKDWSAYL